MKKDIDDNFYDENGDELNVSDYSKIFENIDIVQFPTEAEKFLAIVEKDITNIQLQDNYGCLDNTDIDLDKIPLPSSNILSDLSLRTADIETILQVEINPLEKELSERFCFSTWLKKFKYENIN